MELKELYQEIILDHGKNPRNKGKCEGYTNEAKAHNPLCGDKVHIYLKLNSKKLIEDLSFEGEGCAISLASASILTEITKGKDLPFIIDTPLGRLDSNHRSKLVNNFFPVIGEQVIILSTDTEVDEQFYNDLNPFVKTAYEIKYKDGDNSSTVTEGYFWNQEKQESKRELSA